MTVEHQTTIQGNRCAVVEDRILVLERDRKGRLRVVVGKFDGGMLDETRLDLRTETYIDDEKSFEGRVELWRRHFQDLAGLARIDRAQSSKSTPWGVADASTSYGRGITYYGTPSHGGFKLSDGLNARMPEHLRRENGWYECHVEWARVALAYPERFTALERDRASGLLLQFAPDAWEIQTGTPVVEGMSLKRDEEIRAVRHADDWVVVSATQKSEHPGMVVATATKGGDRTKMHADPATFLVPKGEYDNSFFVIDPERHERIDANAPSAAPSR